MICGLLGEKLGHSYSPQIHSMLGGYEYRLFERESSELDAFFADTKWQGVNVTIPYKRSAMSYCDFISERAQRIGCVNTIVRRDGKLYGYNTDYDGFLALVRLSGLELSGKKALILGSGGASLTAQCVLRELGAEPVVISRSGENNYENIYEHKDALLLVNASPVGMYPNNGECKVELSRLPSLRCVLDLVYNPMRTRLMLDAQRLGIKALGGLHMLVAQAAAASSLFTGAEPEHSETEIYSAIEWEMRNIILIGMPGSGKSTVGAALAARLGRKFIDIDDEIVRAEGVSIPEIFARGGEDEFRTVEHRVLERFTKLSSAVIASGGGAVTREDNIDLLRQNSYVVWLRRDLNKLPTDGRPLSQRGSLEAMYARRRPLYEAASDFPADNNGTVPETVEAIIGEICR